MNTAKVKELVAQLILEVEGGTHLRPPMAETPSRVATMYSDLLDGYTTDIPSLFKIFDGEGKDQVVVMKDIVAYSICEHHLLPFRINVSVGYLPVDKVIGASKLIRLVYAYAHRFQIQERIAKQVAHTLMDNLHPQGVGVVISGEHSCISTRGAKNESARLVTSEMLGEFRVDPVLRAEFFQIIRLE